MLQVCHRVYYCLWLQRDKDLPGGRQDQVNYLLFANYLEAHCTLDQREKPEPDLRSREV